MKLLENIKNRQIITDPKDINGLKNNSNLIASLGYKGIQIDVFNCKMHQFEFLLIAKGLGHEMHIVYFFDPNAPSASPEELVNEVFHDFTEFVIFEREENRPSVH